MTTQAAICLARSIISELRQGREVTEHYLWAWLDDPSSLIAVIAIPTRKRISLHLKNPHTVVRLARLLQDIRP